METMQAIVQETYGSADTWRLDRIARPTPAAGEVLVKVHAAGLDRGTWHVMTGKPYLLRLAMGLRGPRNPVPGLDVAGTVVAVGASVTGFAPGDEVFGVSKGSFAEYAVARADKLARKPANATFTQAAAVPVSALTALIAVRDLGRVRPGQKVLVTGASGGVGSFAVQIAAAFGATVTGTCSTTKTDFVRGLGATHAIDYTREDFADGSPAYDVIVDIAGSPTLSRLRRALAPDGTVVIVGGEGGGNISGMSRQLRAVAMSPFIRQRLTMAVGSQRAADLQVLVELIESGSVTAAVEQTYPLEKAPEAMRALEAGAVRGKTVITL